VSRLQQEQEQHASGGTAQTNSESAAATSKVASAPIVKSFVALLREDLAVVQKEDGCYLTLRFSALKPGAAILYRHARRQADSGPSDEDAGLTVHSSAWSSLPTLEAAQVSTLPYLPGSKQSMDLFLCAGPLADCLANSKSAETQKEGREWHELVIDLVTQSSHCPSEADGGDRAVTAQRSTLKFNDDCKSAHIVSQAITCGQQYQQQALYGVLPHPKLLRSGTSSTELANPTGESGDCVICLSKPRCVAILHCRHVCLCKSCAAITSSTWSFQCPVCRGHVAAMVSAEVSKS